MGRQAAGVLRADRDAREPQRSGHGHGLRAAAALSSGAEPAQEVNAPAQRLTLRGQAARVARERLDVAPVPLPGDALGRAGARGYRGAGAELTGVIGAPAVAGAVAAHRAAVAPHADRVETHAVGRGAWRVARLILAPAHAGAVEGQGARRSRAGSDGAKPVRRRHCDGTARGDRVLAGQALPGILAPAEGVTAVVEGAGVR